MGGSVKPDRAAADDLRPAVPLRLPAFYDPQRSRR